MTACGKKGGPAGQLMPVIRPEARTPGNTEQQTANVDKIYGLRLASSY